MGEEHQGENEKPSGGIHHTRTFFEDGSYFEGFLRVLHLCKLFSRIRPFDEKLTTKGLNATVAIDIPW
ncbi:hypothetical protein [Palaeococcus ferrophilus]|uniref:hypothetical protein n=1 Tax=Palaeococcus ferrophilus TaxID=83868 RepID=UPI0012F90822|nr:hypothetical protein [Palaeococcus ferrophilus]